VGGTETGLSVFAVMRVIIEFVIIASFKLHP
jgi:hypothetical protein